MQRKNKHINKVTGLSENGTITLETLLFIMCFLVHADMVTYTTRVQIMVVRKQRDSCEVTFTLQPSRHLPA